MISLLNWALRVLLVARVAADFSEFFENDKTEAQSILERENAILISEKITKEQEEALIIQKYEYRKWKLERQAFFLKVFCVLAALYALAEMTHAISIELYSIASLLEMGASTFLLFPRLNGVDILFTDVLIPSIPHTSIIGLYNFGEACILALKEFRRNITARIRLWRSNIRQGLRFIGQEIVLVLSFPVIQVKALVTYITDAIHSYINSLYDYVTKKIDYILSLPGRFVNLFWTRNPRDQEILETEEVETDINSTKRDEKQESKFYDFLFWNPSESPSTNDSGTYSEQNNPSSAEDNSKSEENPVENATPIQKSSRLSFKRFSKKLFS